MKDLIPIIIIVLILAGVIFYIVKAKKSGQKCIGCPYSKTCATNKNNGCNASNCCGCQSRCSKCK